MFKRLKLTNTKKLKSTASKYNRKKFKKHVFALIRRMNKNIKDTANKGEFIYRFKISDDYNTNFDEARVAFRWFRRYSGLTISHYKEESNQYESKKKLTHKWVSAVSMDVSWA